MKLFMDFRFLELNSFLISIFFMYFLNVASSLDLFLFVLNLTTKVSASAALTISASEIIEFIKLSALYCLLLYFVLLKFASAFSALSPANLFAISTITCHSGVIVVFLVEFTLLSVK